MSYTPVKTITIVRNRPAESFDLTKPLSSFVRTKSYLVVVQNKALHCLSLSSIISFTVGLDLSQPVGTVFTSLLTDQFVARYESPGIPVALDSGLYANRLKVFNPNTLKDYTVHFTSVNTPHIIDDATKRGFLDDLVIESEHDMTHCLVAVNGVFHRTAYSDGKLYVLDGFRTIRLSGFKDVVVVDTADLGGHTIIPLTTSNVTNSAYQQDAVVTLSQSLIGKTVFAVIDGYFYHRDQEVVSLANEHKLKIHTNKLPLIQQFKHNPRIIRRLDRYGVDVSQTSRQYVDDYERVFLDKDSVATATLATAAFQYSRLTTFHSFLVVINNPDIYTVSLEALPTGTPQFYADHSTRHAAGMIAYGCGLTPSYAIWKDPYGRQFIFLTRRDDHADYQEESYQPAMIPTLIRDPNITKTIPLKFIDYVSAGI